MSYRLQWEIDGRDWPNRAASRFVDAGGVRWHVQVAGEGPCVLLLHGTGAATHSWRDVLPLLAERHTVVAPDLPGHGFSEPVGAGKLSLPGMAKALSGLVAALGVAPEVVVGHSAGAAVGLRLAVDGLSTARGLVSLNGALLPFPGFAGFVFAPIARMLVLNPFVPRLVAWRARDRAAVQRLIDATGSTLDPRGIECYAKLVRSPAHVAGALGMMASWDLDSLVRAMPRVKLPVLLVIGDRDGTVPPSQAKEVASKLPNARVVTLKGVGHLAHEERPEEAVRLIEEAVGTVAVAG